MNLSRDKKEIFSIRKFKSVGASSALIGSLFAASLMTDTVYADETSSPATNLTEKQSDFDNLAKTTEGINETSMEVNYTPDTEFETKVEEAKGWGVTVNENNETVVKEAASMEEANRLIEDLKQQYENKKQELITAIETMKNGGAADQEKLREYSNKLREYNEAKEKFESDLKNAIEYNKNVDIKNKEEKEKYDREYADYLRKLEEYEAYIPVYTNTMAKNYSYLYTMAIEKAVDDDAITMGIWNTQISGGTPLKSETYTNTDDPKYALSHDPGYWEGKTASNYQEGKLSKVGIYSVLLRKGETVTVRYSLKDGSNLIVGDTFENTQGIETDVKYVEYTYTLMDTENASGTAVIHVTNDANIPFYEGVTDYTQHEGIFNGKKSLDLLKNGSTKKDVTIRALDKDNNALRLRMMIWTPEGEKPIVEYLESMTNGLFVNSEKITKVSVPKKKNDKELTEEHQTDFDYEMEDIRNVPDLDPNFRTKKTWSENWSGMLNTQGTGIKYRTFEYAPDTIASSIDPADLNSSETTKLVSKEYKFYNTLTGKEIPAEDLIVNYHESLANVPEFNDPHYAGFNNDKHVGFTIASKDPDTFYDKYVATGANIKLVHTMMNKDKPVVTEFIWNLDSARAKGKDVGKEETLITITDNGVKKQITYAEYKKLVANPTVTTYNKNYTLKDVKVYDVTTGQEYKKVEITPHQSLTYADSELKGMAMEQGVTDLANWAGAKLRPTDVRDFYNNIVQQNKNLKIVYTMQSGDEIKTNEAIWDTSNYRNYNTAQQWYTNFVYGVFAQSKVQGTTTTTWKDIDWSSVKFDGPFTYSAAQSGYQTITKSGWKVGGRFGVSSIGVIRSLFNYDTFIPNINPIEPPKLPAKNEHVPIEVNFDKEPPVPPVTETRANVDLLPNYVIRVKSNLVKNVYNVEGDAKVSIHTDYVAKGSQIYWSLDLDDLPAGRKPTTSLEFKDVLQDGFIFDKALTEAKNPKYIVTYDEATHTVKFDMKMEEVAKLNEVDPTAVGNATTLYETEIIKSPTYTVNTNELGFYNTNFYRIGEDSFVNEYKTSIYLNHLEDPNGLLSNLLVKYKDRNATFDVTLIKPRRNIVDELIKSDFIKNNGDRRHMSYFFADNEDNLYLLYANSSDFSKYYIKKLSDVLGREVKRTNLLLGEVFEEVEATENRDKYNLLTRDDKPISLNDLDLLIEKYVKSKPIKENNIIMIEYNTIESLFSDIVDIAYVDKKLVHLSDVPKLSNNEFSLNKVYTDEEVKTLKLLSESKVPSNAIIDKNSLFGVGGEKSIDLITKSLQKWVNQGYKVIVTTDDAYVDNSMDIYKYNTPKVVNGVLVYQGQFVSSLVEKNQTRENIYRDYLKQGLTPKDIKIKETIDLSIKIDSNESNKVKSIKLVEDGEEREIFNYEDVIKLATSPEKRLQYFDTETEGPYTTFKTTFKPTSENFKIIYELENAPSATNKITVTTEGIVGKESGATYSAFKKVDVLVPPSNGIKSAKVESPLIFGEVVNDGAIYNNNALVIINNGNTEEGGSIITSNTVNVKTPNVKPVKANLDSENKDIDLTPRVVGSTNYYTLTWDLDQYKDIKVTDKEILKGFYYFDDYPEYAVKPETEKVVLKLADGTIVNNVTHNLYNSLEESPQEIKDIVAKTKLNLSKGFQVFKANDPKDFFEKYVKTGKNITIVTPMTVRGDLGRIGTYTNKAYQVDFGNGYYTNEVSNYVVYPEPIKHNQNSEGANINDKTVLPGSVNYYNMYWDLDQFAGIKVTPEDIAKGFYFVDDYPEEAVDIIEGATVTYNGKNVPGISVTLYNSMEEAPENVRKAFANVGYTTTGRIQVFSADNPEQFYNDYVLTGKNLKVVSPMRTKVDFVNKSYRNTAYQLNFGTATSTQTVVNQTPPPPTPVKAVNNTDKVNIDGKKVLAGSDLIYTLGWDLTPYANLKATLEDVDKGFYYFDDYPEEAIKPNTADIPVVKDSKGNVVSGITVTVYNSVAEAPEAIQNLIRTNNKTITGAFQVFSADSTLDFYNNYVIKGERLEITNPMIVKEELKDKTTTFVNRAFQSEFGNLINTNDVTNKTVVPEPDKDVLNIDGININNTIVPIGSTNVYKLKWDLDQYADFVATNKEIDKGFLYVDDYPEEAVTTQDGNVTFKLDDNTVLNNVLTATTYNTLAEAPEDVKAMIEKAGITIKGAFQIFKPVDNRTFYNDYVKTGKNITIETPMTVVTTISNKEFKNNAFQIDFGNTYSTKEVTNTVSVPEPHKQDLDRDGRDINGEIVPLLTTNYYTLTWDLDQYRGMKAVNADINKGFYMIDDFQDDAVNTQDGEVVITVAETGEVVTGITVKTYNSIEEIPANVKKALADINFTTNGKVQLFSANNPVDFFNKYVTTGKTLKVVTPMTLKEEFLGTYFNKAAQIEFNRAVATEVVNNTVGVPTPEKVNKNADDVTINGKSMQPGMTNNYTLTWDLDQYKGSRFSDENINKGFYFVDDFPEAIVTVGEPTLIVEGTDEVVTGVTSRIIDVTELPEDVKLAMAKNGVTLTGTVQLFAPDNANDFYNNYVKTGKRITIISPMTIKDDVVRNTTYNNTAYQVELGRVFTTATITNDIPPVDPHKENLNTEEVDINNTVTVRGMINKYKLTWDLDQYRNNGASSKDIAKGFFFVDDFDEDKVVPLLDEFSVIDPTGTPAIGLTTTEYNSLEEAPENVRKALAKSNFAPKGKFVVISADNPQDFHNKYALTGTNLTVYAPMKVREDLSNDKTHTYINTGYQLDYGNAYITETVTNEVPPVNPRKQNLNKETVDINDTPMYVGATNYYTLTWDLDQFKGIKADKDLIAKGFFFVDDYPEEAVTINVNDIRLLTSNNTDITSEFNIIQVKSLEEAPENVKVTFAKKGYTPNGAIQVFIPKDNTDFYNKYVTTGETIKIVDPMTVKEEMLNTNKSYINTGYQVNFNTAYVTETVTNHVPSVEPHKKDLNKDGIDINKTPMYVGATNYYTLTWDLDQFKNIKATKEDIAKGFFFIDDYPEEAVTINVEDVRLFTSDNKDITSEFNIIQVNSLEEAPENVKLAFAKKGYTPNGAIQVFIPKDNTDFYNKYVTTGETIEIVDPMTVKEEMFNTNKSYYNTGYQVNFNTAYVTETVENHVPGVEPHKEDLNKDFVDINGTVTLPGTVHNYRLTWDLDQFKGIKASKEDIAKGFYFVDDYPEDSVDLIQSTLTLADGTVVPGVSVTVYDTLEEAPKQVQDLIAKYNVTINGKFQVFSADNPEDFYNKYVTTGKSITIIDQMIVKSELKNVAKTYRNQGYQIEFNQLQTTEIVTNNTPVVTPVKEDLNADGIDINGKVMAVGMTNYYKLTWKLDQFKGIKPSKDMIELGFMYIDDFPEEAVTINTDEVVVKTEAGEIVDGLEIKVYNSIDELDPETRAILEKQGVTVKGAFQVFKAVNPQDFYEKYVLTGTNLIITDPMTVKDELKGKQTSYSNIAYQWDMGIVTNTNEVTNEVPPVTPRKQNFNNNKVNIDGKEVLPSSINYYTLTWDLDQYKGIEVDKPTLVKGMFFVDDYPEEAVEILDDSIRYYYTDDSGKEIAITDEIKVTKYNSIEEAPKAVQDALKEINYTTKGAIQVFEPVNLETFHENYTKKGISVKIVDPMKVKPEMAEKGGKYENQAVQIDFGKAHVTEIVTNNVPPLKVLKEVLLNGKDVNNGIIQLNESFKYVINGTYLPGNRSEKLFEYKFVDDYQESHDKFVNYKVIAKVDFTLNIDGQTIDVKANDDLTKYTTLVHENGKIVIDFIDKFYKGLDESQHFQSSAELYMERIAVGDVYNTFSNVVNGVEVISNTVKTSTPQPPAPQTPTPQPPAPKQPELPKTGDSSNATSVVGLLMGSLGLAGLFHKKKRENEV